MALVAGRLGGRSARDGSSLVVAPMGAKHSAQQVWSGPRAISKARAPRRLPATGLQTYPSSDLLVFIGARRHRPRRPGLVLPGRPRNLLDQAFILLHQGVDFFEQLVSLFLKALYPIILSTSLVKKHLDLFILAINSDPEIIDHLGEVFDGRFGGPDEHPLELLVLLALASRNAEVVATRAEEGACRPDQEGGDRDQPRSNDAIHCIDEPPWASS